MLIQIRQWDAKHLGRRLMLLALVAILLFSCTACNDIGESGSDTDTGTMSESGLLFTEMSRDGWDLFADSGEDVQIYFFDIDNLVSEDGESYSRNENLKNSHVKAADCYMVVCGDAEILIDGGFQSNVGDDQIRKNAQDNLLRKIATLISEDGVLDYLIVTHADTDHISSLAVDGGIFDAFLIGSRVETLDGREVRLKQIANIIDFDSNVVREYSDSQLYSNLLLSKDIYKEYRSKRDRLKKANYVPAATLFDDKDFSEEEKSVAMPDDIREKGPAISVPNTKTPQIYDSSYEVKYIEKNGGQLVAVPVTSVQDNTSNEASDDEQDGGQNERYYYEIPIGKDVSLRILYNWYYDHLFRLGKFNPQDCNNISVCLQVVCGDFKFMTFGDLGGRGEDALLNYYAGTDVLSNVTCFKASHHGSTVNGENSSELYAAITPEVVVITGPATSPAYDTLNTSVTLSQEFFDTVEDVRYVLCVNAVAKNRYFQSVPFYGDVCIGFKHESKTVDVSHSYVGDVAIYVNQKSEALSVQTGQEKSIISLPDTSWYEAFFESKTEEGEQP